MLTFTKVQFDVKKSENDLLDEFNKQNIVLVKDTARILESSLYVVSQNGILDKQTLRNGGDIFKIDNDKVKAILLKDIARSSDYKIKELTIGERKVRNLRFSNRNCI